MMSFYILHVTEPGSVISVERGVLICKNSDSGEEKKLPVSDIMGVIAAARGITFTSGAISKLIENSAVIIHCDEKYRPVGLSARMDKIVHNELFEKQIAGNIQLLKALWTKVLEAKVKNQTRVLNKAGINNELEKMFFQGGFDEGNASRYFWKMYFSYFGNDSPGIREHKGASHPINIMLNYAYAVVSAILHRSIIIHGLVPYIGIQHRYRFGANPLVYDLIEPFRPLCEYLLIAYYSKEKDTDLKKWGRYFLSEVSDIRLLNIKGKKTRFLFYIDEYVQSFADAIEHNDPSKFMLPELTEENLEL